MRIGVILGDFSIGSRPIDFKNVWSSPRGLTGTDLAFIRTSEELSKLGHIVEMFSVIPQGCQSYNGMRLRPTSDIDKIDAEDFDAVVNFNEPNLFINRVSKPLRIVHMMLNDFSFIQPGFDEWVDHYFGVCDEHTKYVANQCPHPEKWSTLSLGCDPDLYEDKRVPGRVVWCSSADRGLHWLLSVWADIKKEVPEANLRVFYHFAYDHVIGVEANSISPQGGPYHHHIQEMAQRVRYIKHAMKELKKLDVEHVGSVSRDRMKEEWSQASVFGFCADTVAFSEGFSVSTLEAHASYTVPIITDCDCLGGIYKDSGCIMIPSPVKNNLEEFKNSVIYQLRDMNSDTTKQRIEKCRQFATEHSWANAAKQLEKFIQENKR